MQVTIISLGNVKDDFIHSGEANYLKRLKPLIKLELIEINTKKLASLPPQERIKKEAEMLIDRLKPKDFLIALDENGSPASSQKFSASLEKHMNSSANNLVFAIGGAYGWDQSVKQRAQQTLSLSPMTFTFQMTRLFLVEQIYRSMTIIRNIPYHKE